MKKTLIIALSMSVLVSACDSKKESDSEEKKTDKKVEQEIVQDSTIETGIEVPTPKLGQSALLVVGTTHYTEQLEFYKLLGFEEVFNKTEHGETWAQLNDGSMSIMVYKDTTTYIGPAYFHENTDEIYAYLDSMGSSYYNEMEMEGKRVHVVVNGPDSVGYSVNMGPYPLPQNKNLSAIWGTQDLSLIEFPNEAIGTFQEFAISVEDLDTSIAYWESMGFKSTGIMPGPYRYTIMYDGLMILGLHETKGMWHGNHITYSGDPAILTPTVAKLKEAGYEVVDLASLGMPDNYLVTDPDGNVMNLYSDFRPAN